ILTSIAKIQRDLNLITTLASCLTIGISSIVLHGNLSLIVIAIKSKGFNGYHGYNGHSRNPQGLRGSTERDTYSHYRSHGLVLRPRVAPSATAQSCGRSC